MEYEALISGVDILYVALRGELIGGSRFFVIGVDWVLRIRGL